MALYHLSAKMVSRGKGHSVVAGAAYRAGEKLRDDRTGKIHDYSSREDVAHSEILTPSVAPEWAKDRQAHWNQVDAVEKRKDSQLAREVEVGLQRELTLDRNRELLRAFVQEQFVDRGMVADMSIHWNDNNPHAHILLTTREIDGDGFGKKNRNWNKKELLQEWRESWAEHNNHWLEENDSDARISHQTLAEQGIDREPTKHVGREAWYAHDKELESERWTRLEQREQHYDNIGKFLEASDLHFDENPYEQVMLIDRLKEQERVHQPERTPTPERGIER